METKKEPYVPHFTQEERVAIFKRLLADKRQAEEDIVNNFHTDPLIQAAFIELKRRRKERGRAAI